MPSRWHLNLDPAYRSSMVISLILTLVITLIATASYFFVQSEIPLFYSLARPVDQLARKEWLFVFPIFSVSVTILHLLLITFLSHLDSLIKQLFGWTTIIIQTLIMVVLIRIIILVT